ncbi:unnamed protein product [Mytilus coruscus]|uniref:Reverse transcriptase domain-containing protein n=1 Tax=Mytilus coruscus TaxID=42192 RepID=A0A6J8DNR1_MYTCO|nr:unnamed protein product [Mytilus coruscus]
MTKNGSSTKQSDMMNILNDFLMSHCLRLGKGLELRIVRSFRKRSHKESEQERRCFIEKVEETKLPIDRPVHYIPHHHVAKESSTTPMGIVYGCSCKDGRGNQSLNECLESHPPVMNDITGILMRFRAKKYATTADLEKAFLQIQLDEKDRDATRFLWLSDPADTPIPLITYRFKSVLFGATCSSFILSATLF